MTRRERLERKIEKREAWAAGRRAKASALFARGDRYRGDVAFNTQPGHIPERARVIAATERGFEHAQMADHHDAKASGLAAQLERSIFDDDPDAIVQLEARITAREAARDRMKEVNRLHKNGDAAGLAALGIDLAALNARLAAAGGYWGSRPHLAYELTNLGAAIRADRERIEQIRRRQDRSARAEAAGGVVIEGEAWVRVTFADKPAREILDALRAAGFRWGAGSWVGERAKLPAGVAS